MTTLGRRAISLLWRFEWAESRGCCNCHCNRQEQKEDYATASIADQKAEASRRYLEGWNAMVDDRGNQMRVVSNRAGADLGLITLAGITGGATASIGGVGFVALGSGIAEGSTLAAAYSLATGAFTAGASSATSGIFLNKALGQENTLANFGANFGIGALTFGVFRGIGSLSGEAPLGFRAAAARNAARQSAIRAREIDINAGLDGEVTNFNYFVKPNPGDYDFVGPLLPAGRAPLLRPNGSPNFSVIVEARLKPGSFTASDANHFRQANRQLYEQMQVAPAFAKSLEVRYPDITSHVTPGPRGGFADTSPPGLSWHHDPYTSGNLQLIPRTHHQAPGPIQNSLHPNGKGGREIWGGGRN
jgi:DNase/tRNase domain of colicin-like bacteriocin